MNDLYDILIIGSGPAGHTAAIYGSRADLKVLVLEGWQPGGQLTTTTEVENWPGYREGIMGPQLMADIKAQAQRFGAEYVSGDVTEVDFSAKPLNVMTADKTYEAKTVIIATGAKPRRLGLESESRLWAKGVSACATCDGFFFRGKTVAVIGGGDAAMEEANFLTKFAEKVYLINRSDNFRASQIMIDRVEANDKVEIILNKVVDEVLGENNVTGLRLKDSQSNNLSEIAVDGMFLAIGHMPATELFKDKLELDKMGFIVHKTHTMTSVEGVFAAGDVVDHRYRQGITSAGMGCQAGIDAIRWLDDQEK